MPKESLNPKNGSCEPTPKQLSAVLNMLFVDSVVFILFSEFIMS